MSLLISTSLDWYTVSVYPIEDPSRRIESILHMGVFRFSHSAIYAELQDICDVNLIDEINEKFSFEFSFIHFTITP